MSLPLKGFKPPGRVAPVPSAFSSALLLKSWSRSPELCHGFRALASKGSSSRLICGPVTWVWSETDVHSLSRLWSLLRGFASSPPSWINQGDACWSSPCGDTGRQRSLLWSLASRAWMWLCHTWPLSSPVFLSLNHICSQETKDSLEGWCSCPLFT